MLLVLNMHIVEQNQFVIKRLSNAQAALMHGNTRYLIHVRFIQMSSRCFDNCSSVSMIHEVNAGRPQVLRTPINCSCGMITVAEVSHQILDSGRVLELLYDHLRHPFPSRQSTSAAVVLRMTTLETDCG